MTQARRGAPTARFTPGVAIRLGIILVAWTSALVTIVVLSGDSNAGPYAWAALTSALVGTGVAVAASWAEAAQRRKTRVFLSYSIRDRAVAIDLLRVLYDNGVPVWDPQKEIDPGDRVESEVSHGLDGAHVVVALLSDELSPWVAYEVGRAQASGVKVIPVVVNPEGRKWADSLTPGISYLDATEDRAGAAQRLLRMVKR